MFLPRKTLIQKLYLNNVQEFLRYQTSVNYKNTLLLPKTKFPHKVTAQNRRERDRKIESDGKFEELYGWQQGQTNKEQFILHDGPPYANGDVHIGHAVNKILKDITIRYQLLNGKTVHYVPGWDCHGLPIELKVLKENHATAYETSKMDIRKRAFTFSQKTKEKQMSSFKNWGILADWKNNYYTCHPDYIIQQLNVFQQLYEKEIIFRDYKPVFWSPHNRTSLAEAELEYNTNHVSPSVYVKFEIHNIPSSLKSKLGKYPDPKVLIWTTTPWSLPANQAVCYASDKKYCFIFHKEKGETYLVAEVMLPPLEKILNTKLDIVESFEGSLLREFTYLHPIIKDRQCPFLSSRHVTMDKGTGLVHSAPNHGLDDYTVAKKFDLAIDPCLVDETGCYNNHTITELKGKEVLGSGSKAVLDLLAEDVLHKEDYTHSYPYDWRSKTPVVIRSCHQWFINVQDIKEKALECLDSINIIPEHFKKVFSTQIESSPQWCISRQRAWGVPIPAFYPHGEDTPLVHRSLTEHLCSLIKAHGIHSWWEKDVKDLMPSNLRSSLCLNEKEYQKGSDIMDIWFDSGISWNCVLPDPRVSDMCLEGVDQIRGWFNSLLLISVALRGKAPYKTLFLHGFTTDSDGRKMSKSEGNIISPEDIISGSKANGIPAYGVDVLRWFVAAHGCQSENIAIKMQTLEECSQNINKIRNVLKFLLGNLHDYDPKEITFESFTEQSGLDGYTLYQVKGFTSEVKELYSSMQYKAVSKLILNFVTNTVSSFYCHLVKDRLYCEAQYSELRLQSQTVLYHILCSLIQSIAPVCPHLATEVLLSYPHFQSDKHNVFSYPWPNLDKLLHNAASVSTSARTAMHIKELILESGAKTNMKAIIKCSKGVQSILLDLHSSADDSGLPEFFQVSEVEFSDSMPEDAVVLHGDIVNLDPIPPEKFSVALVPATLKKCPRCRLYRSKDESNLCNRCSDVIANSSKQSSVL